jgi:hypothetical protein
VTTYTHKPWRVAAIQWTGSNFADVEQFVRDYVGEPDQIRLRNESFTFDILGKPRTFNAIQFDAWGSGHALDPGQWIVAPLGCEGMTGEVLDADEFRITYEATQ